jgi:hypothetical protein
MFNPFIIKKWGALFISGLVTTIAFFIGLTFYNFLYALIFMGAGLFLTALIGNVMLDNPFRLMLEGKGVLAINLDSTGVIRPFIMSVKSPYVEGTLNNRLKSDVFDRETVYNLAAPQEAGTVQQGTGKDGKVRIALVLSEEDYNKGRFALFHFPCIIFNEQINSIITKDFLGETEKTAFAEHGVLYLNRKMEELTSAIRDFGRHVVESLKPKGFGITKGTMAIILIIVIIVLLILFAPKLIPALAKAGGAIGGSGNVASGAVQKVAGG